VRKYFAVCANAGENFVTLGEVNVSTTTLDSELFRQIWEEYESLRGFRNGWLRNFLIKPVNVKFVQVGISQPAHVLVHRKAKSPASSSWKIIIE
jgi:hypothetical protein